MAENAVWVAANAGDRQSLVARLGEPEITFDPTYSERVRREAASSTSGTRVPPTAHIVLGYVCGTTNTGSSDSTVYVVVFLDARSKVQGAAIHVD